MDDQQELFPCELLETWRLPSDLPGNVAQLAENFMIESVQSRIERRGHNIFISVLPLALFAERSGRYYLDAKLGVDPERYKAHVSAISGLVDQSFINLPRITPHELDAWIETNTK